MDDLYRKHGFFRNDLASFTFEGADGMAKMASIMDTLRANPPKVLAGEPVTGVVDYQAEGTGLPKSNVLQFQSASGKLLVRPSGTEPKIKLYLSARAASMDEAEALCAAVLRETEAAYLR